VSFQRRPRVTVVFRLLENATDALLRLPIAF